MLLLSVDEATRARVLLAFVLCARLRGVLVHNSANTRCVASRFLLIAVEFLRWIRCRAGKEKKSRARVFAVSFVCLYMRAGAKKKQGTFGCFACCVLVRVLCSTNTLLFALIEVDVPCWG